MFKEANTEGDSSPAEADSPKVQERTSEELELLVNELDAATTAVADDSNRMRKVLESRIIQDEEKMGKLEEELKNAIIQSEEAHMKHDEVAKKVRQVEGEVERTEEKEKIGEIRIQELEKDLRVVENNQKSLEMSVEKANQREASYKEQIKTLSVKLKQVESRVEISEKFALKLQTEVIVKKIYIPSLLLDFLVANLLLLTQLKLCLI